MNVFSSDELASLRTAQASAMQDRCKILAYSSTTDDYGNPSPVYTAGAEIACGVEMLEREPGEMFGTGETPTADVRIRLAVGTVITNYDRVQITRRYGETVSAITYEVVQPPMRGPSGLRVLLRQMG